MKKLKKNIIRAMSFLFAVTFSAGMIVGDWDRAERQATAATPLVKKTDTALHNDITQHFDSNVVKKLPETVASTQDISVIVNMGVDTVMDHYEKSTGKLLLKEYAHTKEAKKVAKSVASRQEVLLKKLKKSGIRYTLGESYDTILSGFEITIKAADFDAVNKLLAADTESIIVGEVYEEAEAYDVVTNDVAVYETGIFDSSKSQYKGDGVVVAVLDTGLDYTHSAFDPENFTTTNEAWKLADVSAKVGQTVAKDFTKGLTGEDVYVNKKVPYAYDYADKDPDVLPINSEHGTHVAGVIAGKDDTIVGVAPNAQLAIMKVFSDVQSGAKTSWILAALEDCVVLGVDVINMSLGSSCGFTREEDRQEINEIYDSIRDAGISLVCAASNDYNATFGSEKNGSNPLTKHPDSGTVGAPSTYEGALSVASVDGVKTPYLLYNNQVMYFNEASTNDGEDKDFVSEVLSTMGDDVDSFDFEYVAIPGIGRSSDYPEDGDFYAGKIVLVKRGTTSFEDKVRVALKEKGAAGIIIYNNVSGTISMAIGDDIGAACSISQDEGEILAAAGSGIITISKKQVAGPFMSDFSSWGPTSDLRIKPEITAHGGEILSSVPGQSYDRQSGTSMASPNQAGVSALIRQYVKYSGVFGDEASLNPTAVTELVNQLMMSTADIVYNKNGLPYAVRKQGAGLVNMYKAQTSASYITTYDKEGNAMAKTKLELGDDKEQLGVYEMKLDIHNISASSVCYDISSLVLTEGVSKTYTSHDDTTSTQDGYLLEGATTTVLSVSRGSQSGNAVTVAANQTATVAVRITLSDADKQYITSSFENGMYVEGFLTFKPTQGTEVSLSVPFLAFFGDWTQAPIFDEEYYDTNKDELNAGLDVEDKLMADAYATRVVGSMYSDYISYLGAYYFNQDPSATPIAASKEHIALSNNENGSASSVNGIYGIFAGLLRNSKEVVMTVTEDSTGKVIYEHSEYNVQKSFSQGTSMYASMIDMDFSVLENNLRNNTRYTVRLEAFIDYGEKSEQNNKRNVFEFPLYIDYEAPVVTDVEYRAEYDKTTKKTKLFADVSIYDNHYAMSLQLGQIVPEDDPTSGYLVEMKSFGKYFTPIYSSFNSTSKVTVELTDYVSDIKNSVTLADDGKGGQKIVEKTNTFLAFCYDYALNATAYEISLPDEVLAMYFTEEKVNINLNETKDLTQYVKVFPEESWVQTLDFQSSDPSVVDVVNQSIVAKGNGDAVITAVGYDANGNQKTASIQVHVLQEGEEGYSNRFTTPGVNRFAVTGYTTNKAFHEQSSDMRDIGTTGNTYSFGKSTALSMYPSESVTLHYTLDSYYPEKTEVVYQSGNENIVTVDENGTITARSKGSAAITVAVLYDGAKTFYTATINITVKDPFSINSIYLMYYKGNGGEVIIPEGRGITTIYEYAFSNYDFVDKDTSAGDVIDEEDPSTVKPAAIGEDTIEKVVIPEGVTHINASAFENLTALKEVVLPSTLINIGQNAFAGCTKLTTINLEKVKFINANAFYGCALDTVDLSSVVAIGNYAFYGCSIGEAVLPATSQSLGEGAFAANESLEAIVFEASKIKIGPSVFDGCIRLRSVSINAAVISSYAFYGCTDLTNVTLGKDVAVIGEYAFAETNVSKFTVASDNVAGFTTKESGALLYKGTELILAAPKYAGTRGAVTLSGTTAIATGAFAGNANIESVTANDVKTVGAYAFTGCMGLDTVEMNKVEEIGDYAFIGTTLAATPNLSNVKKIGAYAFAGMSDSNGQIFSNSIREVTIPDNAEVGDYAFYLNINLKTVTLGNAVKVGGYAFASEIVLYAFETLYELDPEWAEQNMQMLFNQYYTSYLYAAPNGQTFEYYRYDYAIHRQESALTSVTVGNDCILGTSAFDGSLFLQTVTLGNNVSIGDFAFYNARALTSIDLSNVKHIGDYAFAGFRTNDFDLSTGDVGYAFKYEVAEGELVPVDYKYTSFAPALTSVNFSNLESMGEAAFANVVTLQEIVFAGASDVFTAIPSYAFINCEALTTLTLPEYITEIGEYAFAVTSLEEVDLSNVSLLGEYAFSNSMLKKVILKEGATLADGIFNSCLDLAEVTNLDKAVSIGANAFRGVSLTSADLSAATYVGDFAFSQSLLTEVTLGDQLTGLGNNPFYGCALDAFKKEVDILFNETVVGKEVSDTFDLSEKVKVIDGVLYQVTPNGGLELITYPMNKKSSGFVVAEGTTKIGERAFAGASLRYVTLPSTLQAIGDKAFYECKNLNTVEFKSLYAPTLEEEFDEYYMSFENMPLPGSYSGYEGLGILPFTNQWDINQTTFFYGANFVDYIGHLTNKLVMVKPANGLHYDSFIYGQYFETVLEGNHTPVEATQSVIALIQNLPASISLSNEEAVNAALKAYQALAPSQQGLISSELVSKLNDAVSMIEYLKLREEGGNEEPVDPVPPSDEVEKDGLEAWAIVLIVVGGVLVVGGAGVGGFFLFKKKKANTSAKEE